MATEMIERPGAALSCGTEPTCCERFYRPNVDILETPNELTLFADMPGADAGSIDVNFENGTLTISAKVSARQNAETRFLVREYGVGGFRRSFEVGEAIDAAKITAEFVQGVLTLHLPKVEAVKPRKIKVTT
jgi:HSP20 family molecular chaperone IbpA